MSGLFQNKIRLWKSGGCGCGQYSMGQKKYKRSSPQIAKNIIKKAKTV